MVKSAVIHCEMECDIIPEKEVDVTDGVPEDQYYGQCIWDGHKLVTEKEWELQNQERRRK